MNGPRCKAEIYIHTEQYHDALLLRCEIAGGHTEQHKTTLTADAGTSWSVIWTSEAYSKDA